MNDRFKFRVYNKRKEEMLDVRLISYFSTGNICRVEAQNAVGDIKIFDDYKTSIEDIELLQCTGLKDKNGKLIYEGDIIKDVLMNKFVVDFSQGYLSFLLTNIKNEKSMVFYPNINIEVIGNIYENKELLHE